MHPKLSKLTRLGNSVSVFVPSLIHATENDGGAKQKEWTDRLMVEQAKMFGGVSVYTVEGGWWSGTHGLIREGVKVVQSMASDADLDAHIKTVIGLAERMKADMSQEAVSVMVNGEMYLV